MAGAWRRTDLDSFDPEDQEGLAWFFHLHDEVDLAIRLLRVVAREKAILSLRRLRQDVALKIESSDRRFKLLAKISGIDVGEDDGPRREGKAKDLEGLYTEPANVRDEMRYQSDFVGQEIERLDREQTEEMDELAGAAKEMGWATNPNQWREDLARLLDQFRELRASSDANNGGSFIEGFLKAIQSAGAFKLRALKKREKATVALYRNVQTVLAHQGKRWAYACSVTEGELIKRGIPVSNRLPPVFEDSGFYLYNKGSDRSITAEEVEEVVQDISVRAESARERERREAEEVAATLEEAKRRAKEAIARQEANGGGGAGPSMLLGTGAPHQTPRATSARGANGVHRLEAPGTPLSASTVLVASIIGAEEARERLNHREQELDAASRDLQAAIAAKEAAEERVERLAREREHMRQELQLALNVKDDMTARRDALLLDVSALHERLAVAMREREAEREEHAHAQEQIAAVARDLEAERRAKGEWQGALERERAEMRTLSREIVEVANEAEREVAKARDLQREHAALKARVAELEKLEAAVALTRQAPPPAPSPPAPLPPPGASPAPPPRADKELQTSPRRAETPAGEAGAGAIAARLARRVEALEDECSRARQAAEALQRERSEAVAELRSALLAEERRERAQREAMAAMTGDMRRLARELNACLDEKEAVKRQLERLLAQGTPPTRPKGGPPPRSASATFPAPLPDPAGYSSSESGASSAVPTPLPLRTPLPAGRPPPPASLGVLSADAEAIIRGSPAASAALQTLVRLQQATRYKGSNPPSASTSRTASRVPSPAPSAGPACPAGDESPTGPPPAPPTSARGPPPARAPAASPRAAPPGAPGPSPTRPSRVSVFRVSGQSPSKLTLAGLVLANPPAPPVP